MMTKITTDIKLLLVAAEDARIPRNQKKKKIFDKGKKFLAKFEKKINFKEKKYSKIINNNLQNNQKNMANNMLWPYKLLTKWLVN